MIRFVVCAVALLAVCPGVLAKEDDLLAIQLQRHDQATVGTIDYLSLIDANKDEQPYTYLNEYQYGVLPPKVHIYRSNYYYAPAFSVTAGTSGNIGSVVWEFDGSKRIENKPIWAMCGNSGRDIFPCPKLVDGFSSVIKATPFSGPNGSGTSGQPVSVEMKISKGTPLQFILINAKTDKDIGPFKNDGPFSRTDFDFSTAKEINIKAVGDPNVKIGSMVLHFEEPYGRSFKRIENGAPYAFFGHNGSDFFPFTPQHGSSTVRASAFSERNGKGDLIGAQLLYLNMNGNLQPPTLLNFSFVPPSSFNITTQPVINMKVVVQDEFPGLIYATVYARNLDFFQKVVASIAVVEDQPTIMNVAFPFGPFLRNGRYEISVELSDSFKNRGEVSTASLSASGFPSFIDVADAPGDVTPPKVISLVATSPMGVDVAPSSATAQVKVVLVDDLSGVASIELTAVSPYNGETYSDYIYEERPYVLGKPIERILNIEFDRYLLPGKYPLFLRVLDGFGNDIFLNSTSLSRNGFSHFIQVNRSYNDTTPPEVGTFNCYTCVEGVAIVDVSSDDQRTVEFGANFEDDLSGFGYFSFTAANPGGASKKYEWTNEENEGASYVAEFTFDESSQLGVYELTLYLVDNDGNAATVTSADLIARGDVGTFTVIKSK